MPPFIEDNLPALFALIGVLLTVFVNFALGIIKARMDRKGSSISQEGAFRDDLMQMNNDLSKRVEAQDKIIKELQTTITDLWKENNLKSRENVSLELKIERLEADKIKMNTQITELQEIVQKIQNKVWYRKESKDSE